MGLIKRAQRFLGDEAGVAPRHAEGAFDTVRQVKRREAKAVFVGALKLQGDFLSKLQLARIELCAQRFNRHGGLAALYPGIDEQLH